MKRSVYLLFGILLSGSPLYAQVTNNTGKIFFTDKRIDPAAQHEFMNSYRLSNKSDLFFVAFLKEPLTGYKHRLSPASTPDSLFKKGNFQFTLFVDGTEIYRSNLLPGAPMVNVQDSGLILNRPLVDNKQGQGSWSESFWNRFLNAGGDSALTDGLHQLKMEIRGYVKNDSLLVGDILAEGKLNLVVARKVRPDISKIQLHKPKPYKGFPLSNESFDTNMLKEIKGLIDSGYFKKINGIVVIKKGKLLIEEYFNGDSRSTLHDTRSVGKSFVSTLTGIAIHDGHIVSEQQELNSFYPNDAAILASEGKRQTTLYELLTMSSGFDGNDEDPRSPGNEENMYPTDDWVRFTLDLPFKPEMKSNWHYFTAGVVLLGDILNRNVAGGLERYADKKLFAPLGIKKYQWQYTPKAVPNTAGGLRLSALDYAKYGQLYKNDGLWEGKQIIPASWVRASFTRQKKIINRTEEYYGYLFWNKTFISNGKAYEAFYCAGNGGNYILVFQDQPLVIVITASAYGQPYAHRQVNELLTKYLLPAVIR